jgi:hypothetical protein
VNIQFYFNSSAIKDEIVSQFKENILQKNSLIENKKVEKYDLRYF